MSRKCTKIYLVQSQQGHIKIGCSENPELRVNNFNGASPIPCRLVAVWDGDFSHERALLDKYISVRCHGEWFFPSVEISEFVSSKWGQGLEEVMDFDALNPIGETVKERSKRRRSESHKRNWADPEWREERMANLARQKSWREQRELAASQPRVSNRGTA